MHSLFKGMIAAFALAFAYSIPLCPSATEEQAQAAEVALTDFAIDLLRNVTAKDETKNQVVSPLSIALALALLENGADGKTREQLRRVLVGGDPNVDVLTAYRAVQKQVLIDDDETTLTVANGLFQDQSTALNEKFVTTTRDCLDTRVDNDVDFEHEVELAREKINKWVHEKTNGKIYELYKPGVLSKQVRTVLANAVYLKASWLNEFDRASTRHRAFYRNGKDEDKQIVPFMRHTGEFHYVDDDDLTALELPYEHGDLAMYVVLPKARDGLGAVEKSLTGEQLRSIVSRVRQRLVEVDLPRFTVRVKSDLKQILTEMDLGSMFTSEASFGRMSEKKLQVDSVTHEAYIHVTETGTEAAAATGVAIMQRGMPIIPRPPVTKFIADHPYLFVVVHARTGAIVFLGKVTSVDTHNE